MVFKYIELTLLSISISENSIWHITNTNPTGHNNNNNIWINSIKVLISNRVPLAKREKIQILWDFEKYGHQWKFISWKRGRSADTVKSFYQLYNTFETFSPKRGRPKKITDKVKKRCCSRYAG